MNGLEKRALTGVARFQITLALLLFLPAGTLRFWQAWVYWALHSMALFWMTLHFLKRDPALIQRRLLGGPRHEKQRNQKIITALASVLGIGSMLLPGIERRFHPSPVPLPVVLAADALLVVAFWLTSLVFQANSHASSVIEVTAQQRVVATGPYRFVRHPMYSACVLLFLATPPALGSLWAFAGFLPLCAIMVARLIYEEEFLAKNLPGYEEYRREVPYRLIPGVW